jgi:hypothetical protein
VISANCTAPAYDRIDTPTPMSPDCGTQNMICFNGAPAMYSCCCGPGTLVITAVALRASRSSTCFCTLRGARPAMPSSAIASTAV